MVTGTLSRYFGRRFLSAVMAVFVGIIALVALIDYIETMRRSADVPNVSAFTVARISLFRVPQVVERIMPFAVLVGAMSCYLSLSRRLELVVARAAGVSAWQFVAPAVIVALALGTLATTLYNPLAASLHERSKRLEMEIVGGSPQSALQSTGSGFWVRQRSNDGQAIINAASASEKGLRLSGVTIFRFDLAGQFMERIEAKSAVLENGFWRLTEARIFAADAPPRDRMEYRLNTNLSPEQVRESFSSPEMVPFWDLPSSIKLAEHAGVGVAGYRLQFQRLIARPFLFAAMVLLAAAVSLRLFRFGGVQRMVLSGIGAGFLLYVLSKVTEDLSKAELMHPGVAAWLPVFVGGLTGLVALLYQEDG